MHETIDITSKKKKEKEKRNVCIQYMSCHMYAYLHVLEM